MISVFDLFKIGIGPSSSHTVGPMVAANLFLTSLLKQSALTTIKNIEIELYGSLAATGKGHATDTAIYLGLLGHTPSTIDTRVTGEYLAPIFADKQLNLSRKHSIDFYTERDVYWYDDTVLRSQPNALTARAILADGIKYEETYYSVGGGFVINEDDANNPDEDHAGPTIDIEPCRLNTAAELLDQCHQHGL